MWRMRTIAWWFVRHHPPARASFWLRPSVVLGSTFVSVPTCGHPGLSDLSTTKNPQTPHMQRIILHTAPHRTTPHHTPHTTGPWQRACPTEASRIIAKWRESGRRQLVSTPAYVPRLLQRHRAPQQRNVCTYTCAHTQYMCGTAHVHHSCVCVHTQFLQNSIVGVKTTQGLPGSPEVTVCRIEGWRLAVLCSLGRRVPRSTAWHGKTTP